jgi:hypothetical protein
MTVRPKDISSRFLSYIASSEPRRSHQSYSPRTSPNKSARISQFGLLPDQSEVNTVCLPQWPCCPAFHFTLTSTCYTRFMSVHYDLCFDLHLLPQTSTTNSIVVEAAEHKQSRATYLQHHLWFKLTRKQRQDLGFKADLQLPA